MAGLVGIGLSQLFGTARLESPEFADMEDLSNHMGLFLQKTNIIRDYLEDITEVWRGGRQPLPACGAFACIYVTAKLLESSSDPTGVRQSLGFTVEPLFISQTKAGCQQCLLAWFPWQPRVRTDRYAIQMPTKGASEVLC